MRIVSLGVFTLVVVALMFVEGRAPGLTGSPASAAAVPLSGFGVYHAEATHVWTSPTGEQGEVRHAEYWFDPQTGDARYEQRSLTGDYHTVFRRKGRTYSTEYVRHNMVSTETYTTDDAPMLRSVQEDVLHYKAALERGDLRGVVGEEMVDGQLAIVVQEQVDLEGIDLLRTSVSETTGLPIQTLSYRERELGGFDLVERYQVSYPLVERVDRESLPADLFSPPAAARRESQTYLTQETAAQFREFGLYWLSPISGGLPLATIFHSESGSGDSPESAVQIVYAEMPADERQAPSTDLQLHQRAASAVPEAGCGGFDGDHPSGETVTISGRQALLCDQGQDGVTLNLTLDGTLVRVHGVSRQQVVQAAESLQKLN